MILFYSARRSDLAAIEEEGLPRQKKRTYTLYSDLRQARSAPGRVVVAIDPAIDGSWLSHVMDQDSINVREVPRRFIMNLEPYLKPKTVRAGGGVLSRIKDNRREVLLIFRRGLWDLPKGKRDSGESIKNCARREVMEEVGIGSVEIRRPLGETFHGYRDNNYFAVKQTRWYEMHTTEAGLVPQREEGIEKVQWFLLEDAMAHLGFPLLRSLLRNSSEVICR